MQVFMRYLQRGTFSELLCALMLLLCLGLFVTLISLIVFKGMSSFWPAPIASIQWKDSANEVVWLGRIIRKDNQQRADLINTEQVTQRWFIQLGNRDLSTADYAWLNSSTIESVSYPLNAWHLERNEWGDFLGYPQALVIGDVVFKIRSPQYFAQLLNHWITTGEINHQLFQLALAEPEDIKPLPILLLQNGNLIMRTASAHVEGIPLTSLIKVTAANSLSFTEKVSYFFDNFWRFLTENPREANSEGGILPAIFGTVLLVFLMSIMAVPIGVLAAIYMHEYAKQGFRLQVVRAAIYNLAGVPSIVFGVVGLGLFVYGLGGVIDRSWFAEQLPSPTFGTPGLFWASLTLSLLTLPVVIVATEEGLSQISNADREASYALGATQAETLIKIVLPALMPAILTGLTLAVARAAGEVAPLMLVGVVKLAPSLPLIEGFPFLQLDQKIMHLGYHIYDLGMQSPHIEKAREALFSTSCVLVLLIISLNGLAIALRQRLRLRLQKRGE